MNYDLSSFRTMLHKLDEREGLEHNDYVWLIYLLENHPHYVKLVQQKREIEKQIESLQTQSRNL